MKNHAAMTARFLAGHITHAQYAKFCAAYRAQAKRLNDSLRAKAGTK